MSCGNAGLVTNANAYTPPTSGGANPDEDVTLAGAQTISGSKTFTGEIILNNATTLYQFANVENYILQRGAVQPVFGTLTPLPVVIPAGFTPTPCLVESLPLPKGAIVVDFSALVESTPGDTLINYSLSASISSGATVYDVFNQSQEFLAGTTSTTVSMFTGAYVGSGGWTLSVLLNCNTDLNDDITIAPTVNIGTQQYL